MTLPKDWWPGPTVWPEVKKDDIYVFTRSVLGGSGKEYRAGETLFIFEETGESPFGQKSPSGKYWKVVCRYYQPPDKESVWASIEHMIQRGLLKKWSP